MHKSAHLDNFSEPSSVKFMPALATSTRARSETHVSAKFLGLLVAAGFSLGVWIVAFQLVVNFLHA